MQRLTSPPAFRVHFIWQFETAKSKDYEWTCQTSACLHGSVHCKMNTHPGAVVYCTEVKYSPTVCRSSISNVVINKEPSGLLFLLVIGDKTPTSLLNVCSKISAQKSSAQEQRDELNHQLIQTVHPNHPEGQIRARAEHFSSIRKAFLNPQMCLLTCEVW